MMILLVNLLDVLMCFIGRIEFGEEVVYCDIIVVGKVFFLVFILVVFLIGNVLVCYCGLCFFWMFVMNSLIVNLLIGELVMVLIVILFKIE